MTNQGELFGERLDTLEPEAFQFLSEHFPAEQGYWEVAFSGGKDSCVLYHLVKRWSESTGFRIQATYIDTTIDPPEVRKFIKEHYPEVTKIIVSPGFFARTKTRGIPLRNKRWCCDALKKEQAPAVNKLTGVRAEESYQRKRRGRILDFGKYKSYHPIFDWTEGDVWMYTDKYDLPVCSLYDEGFPRIGCVVCPQLSPPQMRRNRERWPAYFKAFENVFRKRWERTYPDDDWRLALDNWYNNRPLLPKSKDGEIQF